LVENSGLAAFKVLSGNVNDLPKDSCRQLTEGDQLILQQGERHRLIGLDETSVVAEIWQHTDANHPLEEDDIIRVQDDFGR